MALIGFKCGFERGAFSLIIAGDLVDLGKIEPQRGSPGIRLDRRFEMAPGRVGILPDERFHAEDVVSDRVIGTEAERGFGFADHIGAACPAAAPGRRARDVVRPVIATGRDDFRICARSRHGLQGPAALLTSFAMAANVPALAEIIADGRWLAHRYDETNDAIQFRFVPREAQQALTFLTDAEIGDADLAVYPREDCLTAARRLDLPTPRMIFHSAYCCSTLLTQVFDIPGTSFGLKEPQVLNDVVGLQLRRRDARQVAAAMDVALLLLARPLGPGETNVIKPSNLLNPLIPLLTAMRPDIRGVLLDAPLYVFLTSIARKEIEGRAWVRQLMWDFIRMGQAARFGFTEEDLYRQTDLQVGALGWLAQQAMFAEATTKHADPNNRQRSADLASSRMSKEAQRPVRTRL